MRKFIKDSKYIFATIVTIVVIVLFLVWLFSGLQWPEVKAWMDKPAVDMSISDVIICIIILAILSRD